jgi:hypothetical protein
MCLSQTRTTHLKDIESTLQHVPTEKLSGLVPDKLLEPRGSIPEGTGTVASEVWLRPNWTK